MVFMSLKGPLEKGEYLPIFWSNELRFDNFVEVLRKNSVGRYALSSVIVAVGSAGLSLLLGAPAAYGVAKWKRHRVALSLRVARLVPELSFLIPWSSCFRTGVCRTPTWHASLPTWL